MAGTKRDFALIKHGHALGELDDLDLAGAADNSLIQYDSASGDWQDVTLTAFNGQLDHGLLLGLSDNDHPQYARLAIAETITETWTWTDNDEVRLGTGGDLRLYHDGTNSVIQNDNGLLLVYLNSATQDALFAANTDWALSGVTETPNIIAERAVKVLRAGTASAPTFRGYSYGSAGSRSAPAALVAGDGLFALDGAGYDGTSFGTRIYARAFAGETWSSSVHGSYWYFGTTALGGNAARNTVGVWSDGGLRIILDNAELSIGAGGGSTNNAAGDLRLYHNGTNSVIRNDTGHLIIQQGSTEYFRFGSAGQIGLSGANYGTSGHVLTSQGASAAPIWQAAGTGLASLATEIAADSPSGYWKMDEASGNFADSSGNGRTLTASGSITYQSAAFIPSEPTTKYALFASGAGATASGTFSMAPLTGDYTIEGIFVGATYATNPTVIFGMGGAGETEVLNVQTSLRIDTNSRMSQFWESGAGADTTPATVIEVVEGKVYHYACVKDGTANTVTFWLNGLKVSTVSYVNDPTGGTDGGMVTGIGTVASVTSNGMQIAHVAFYNGSKLSDARIVAHARAAGLFGY